MLTDVAELLGLILDINILIYYAKETIIYYDKETPPTQKASAQSILNHVIHTRHVFPIKKMNYCL